MTTPTAIATLSSVDGLHVLVSTDAGVISYFNSNSITDLGSLTEEETKKFNNAVNAVLAAKRQGARFSNSYVRSFINKCKSVTNER